MKRNVTDAEGGAHDDLESRNALKKHEDRMNELLGLAPETEEQFAKRVKEGASKYRRQRRGEICTKSERELTPDEPLFWAVRRDGLRAFTGQY
jgi:hypothetical protein